MPPGTAGDAAALGLDIAGLDDQAIAAAVKAERDRRWREENREALESWNVWIEKNGLPLERYRLF